MQENILNAFAEQAKTMYAPMSKFNSLFVENMEKLTEYQINAVKSYAEMGLSQMKSAADVQDLESMRTFASSQAEVASGMNKKIMAGRLHPRERVRRTIRRVHFNRHGAGRQGNGIGIGRHTGGACLRCLCREQHRTR